MLRWMFCAAIAALSTLAGTVQAAPKSPTKPATPVKLTAPPKKATLVPAATTVAKPVQAQYFPDPSKKYQYPYPLPNPHLPPWISTVPLP